MTRSDVRAASGTRTRMPSPSRPKCASGSDAVVQVVDGDDAGVATGGGRGAGEAVQHVDPGAAPEARQRALLGAHAGDPARAVDPDRDDLRVLLPRPAGRRGLAVDERRQPQVGPLGGERGEQLARVDLHAAGLAGHEEQQVQADVHGP